MSDWTLRTTSPEDEDFLWVMLFYASHSNDEPGVTRADVRSNPDLVGYIEGWRLAGSPGVVAESGGTRVGAAWLRVLGEADVANPVFAGLDIPELAVAVEPGSQGRGIGSAMIERLLFESRDRFPAVVLSSRADNPAVSLYERLGFKVVEEITNRVGTRSVKMLADL